MNFLFAGIKKPLTFALLNSGTSRSVYVTLNLLKGDGYTKDLTVRKVHQVLLKHS